MQGHRSGLMICAAATTWPAIRAAKLGGDCNRRVINKNYGQIKLMSGDLSFLSPYISGSSGRPIKYGQHIVVRVARGRG